jgi:uncharacterized GH25 family protein
MTRRFLPLVLLAAAIPALVQAHFIWVLPEKGNAKAVVFLSEELKPAPEVGADYVKNARLILRDAAGRETALNLLKGSDAYVVELGAGGSLLHGVLDLGYTQRGPSKPHLLMYYPKTILTGAFDAQTQIGKASPVEIVPTGKPGSMTLKFLAHGKPVPDSELTVIFPDGKQKKMKTGANGETESIAETGRFGAWARFWEPVGGERDGKKYEETRNYATIVFDAAAKQISSTGPTITAKAVATLPEATSAFGAVATGGYLYIYGGHISPTHSYSTAAVSGKFNRLKLADGTWESLRGGQGLQGMNLAEHQGKVILIGGMSPRNAPGEKTDTRSVADCALFDPKTKEWQKLPSLPEARSSHDVVVIGSKVIVVGGWNLKGPEPSTWATDLQILDLAAKNPEWKSAPQPFKRRALIASAHDGKMYVIGGFDEKNNVIREVAIYDAAANTWSKAPELPVDNQNSFAPAAAVHGGALYVSVADGRMFKLDETKQSWQEVGRSTPRLAHRVVSTKDELLVIGGANKGKNSDLVEAIPLTR